MRNSKPRHAPPPLADIGIHVPRLGTRQQPAWRVALIGLKWEPLTVRKVRNLIRRERPDADANAVLHHIQRCRYVTTDRRSGLVRLTILGHGRLISRTGRRRGE